MSSRDHEPRAPLLLETAGALLVVVGLSLAWLPLGLISLGALLFVLAQVAEAAKAKVD